MFKSNDSGENQNSSYNVTSCCCLVCVCVCVCVCACVRACVRVCVFPKYSLNEYKSKKVFSA